MISYSEIMPVRSGHSAARILIFVLAVFAATACGQTSATPPGGTVRALAADPAHAGRVLLGTNTGVVFVSGDGGAGWSFLSRIAPHDDWVVSRLVADPSHAGRWYAALWSWSGPGGGVYASSDDGATWQPLWTGHAVRALALAPSDAATLVAGTLDGVWRSQDGGRQWARISGAGDRELSNIESVAIDPVNAQEIYVGTWHLPWKTVNGGHDWWQMRQGVIDDSDVFSIAVDRQHPATVYLSACSGIYRSQDRGNQFQKIQGIPYSARRTPALVQDPDDPATIYAGTTQGLWVTHDAGATWARITPAAWSVNAVVPISGGTAASKSADAALGPVRRLVLGLQFAGVEVTSDGGASFYAANRGFSSRHVSAVASAPAGRFVAVTGDEAWGGIFLAAPDGAWQAVPAPLPGQDVYSLHWSPTGLLAATAQGVYRLPAPGAKAGRPDRGRPERASWTLARSAPHDHIYALAAPAPRSALVYAAAQSGLYRSADGGVSWSALRAAPAPLFRVLALPPEEGEAWLFVAGDGFVLRSSDGGQHFLPGRLAIPGTIQQLAYSGPLLLAATSRGLYQSRDRGASWTLTGHGLPAANIQAVQVQADGIYVLTAQVGEVFVSRDGGVSWTQTRMTAQQEAEARSGPGVEAQWRPAVAASAAGAGAGTSPVSALHDAPPLGR
jgi:photosystem II stability/assembly factor-like uncharacterized protein